MSKSKLQKLAEVLTSFDADARFIRSQMAVLFTTPEDAQVRANYERILLKRRESFLVDLEAVSRHLTEIKMV